MSGGDFYYFRSFEGDAMLDAVLKNSSDETKKQFEDNIKNINLLVNVNYPELTGTEKQINYAKILIKKRLKRDIDMVIEDNLREDVLLSRNKKFIEAAKKLDPSIETFSDAVNFGLKNKKGSVLKFIQENPSAAKIIDKYK